MGYPGKETTSVGKADYFPKIILAIAVFFLALTLFSNLSRDSRLHSHFSYLAKSFLAGQSHISESSIGSLRSTHDMAFYKGKYYWPLGPFPAVLLIPFVILSDLSGTLLFEAHLNIALVIGVFFLYLNVIRGLGYTKSDSLFWAVAFVFVSPFLATASVPISWYFAHTVTVFLLLLFIREFLGRKRYFLLGCYASCTLATRITGGICAVLVALLSLMLLENDAWKKKLSNFAQLILPFVTTGTALALYNYVRFDNVFEMGYSLQKTADELVKAKSYGLYNPIHIPGNLYYAFLSTPLPVFKDELSRVLTYPYVKPSPWGLSLFIISPYLLKLFIFRYRDVFSRIVIASVAIVAVLIFMYYGIGFYQFGYRYALDFLPFVFLLFAAKYREKYGEILKADKILIIVFSFIDLFLMTNMY